MKERDQGSGGSPITPNSSGIFRYHVSLRITHAEIEPEIVTHALDLIPDEVERKGDPIQLDRFKKLPAEAFAVLRGKNRWFKMFEPGNPAEPLSSCLRRAILLLQERSHFIRQVHETGGRVELTVHFYPPIGSGPPFDYSLIDQLLQLGIGFALYMHPREDYVRDPSDWIRSPVT